MCGPSIASREVGAQVPVILPRTLTDCSVEGATFMANLYRFLSCRGVSGLGMKASHAGPISLSFLSRDIVHFPQIRWVATLKSTGTCGWWSDELSQ